MLDLISVMLIRSGNEAANAIAEYLSGSVESFADLMNQTAQMLGCSPNTHFANPSGVHDENHYTTARDLAIIAQACMKDERFASIVSQTSYDMPATQTESGAAGHPRRTIVGSTAILNPENETSYYRYATGIKTGYTLAGRLLLCRLGDKRRHQSDFRRALRRRYPPLRGHQAPV